MENLDRKVNRVINAQTVKLLENGEMKFSCIGFDADEGHIEKGVTSVRIWHDQPNFYSSADSGFRLVGKNYFIGEAKVNWIPKYALRKPEFKGTNEEELVDGYVILLPDTECEKLYQKAIQAKREIRGWIDLWYLSKSQHYDFMFRWGKKAKVVELENRVEEDWKKLEEKGLVINNVLYNPQFLYIISTDEKIKEKCFKKAKEFGLTWITPNACVADNEDNFKNLIKSYYEWRKRF